MPIVLDESLVTLITTLLTIGLAIFSKYKHDQSVALKGDLNVAVQKSELGANLLKKIRDANEDNQITNEEFTGILNTAEELVNSKN